MKNLLVSVVISTYNREKLLPRALESVLGQTFRDFELTVVNDGSTDNTQKFLDDFLRRDGRVRQIVNETNLGLVESLNKGINVSHGKYIARIDDDDYWCDPQKLEKQITFLESNPDYVAVGGGEIEMDSTGKEVGRFLLLENDERLKNLMLFHNPFVHSAVVFRKNAWVQAGEYDEVFSSTNSEDWDLWLRLGKLGKFYNFQQYFVRYLKGQQNKSNYNIQHNLMINIRLRKKYRNDYPNFWKAYIFGWARYIHSFLPLRKSLHPVFSALRRIIFGRPVYKSFVNEKE